MTDLRDPVADIDDAVYRPHPIRLTTGTTIGYALRTLRKAAGLTPDALARRLHMSRSGLCKREVDGRGHTADLIAHFGALGYDVFIVPRDRRHM